MMLSRKIIEHLVREELDKHGKIVSGNVGDAKTMEILRVIRVGLAAGINSLGHELRDALRYILDHNFRHAALFPQAYLEMEDIDAAKMYVAKGEKRIEDVANALGMRSNEDKFINIVHDLDLDDSKKMFDDVAQMLQPGAPVAVKMTESQLKQIIREELASSGYLGNGYKWCQSGVKCSPQQSKTNWWGTNK